MSSGEPRQEEALLGAKMVGRWQSGAPLAVSPERDDPALGADPHRHNAFSYGDAPARFQVLCPVRMRGGRILVMRSMTSGSVDVRLHG